jgi:hypothetical protein
VKIQSTEWEKITANHVCDKGVLPRIYKPLQHNKKRQTQVKMGKAHEQTFFQRRYSNEHQSHEKMVKIPKN